MSSIRMREKVWHDYNGNNSNHKEMSTSSGGIRSLGLKLSCIKHEWYAMHPLEIGISFFLFLAYRMNLTFLNQLWKLE